MHTRIQAYILIYNHQESKSIKSKFKYYFGTPKEVCYSSATQSVVCGPPFTNVQWDKHLENFNRNLTQ